MKSKLLTIVGTRIYLSEGDTCAFKIQYRNNEDRVLNFSATDILTLTIRDRETRKPLLTKVAEAVKISGEECSIFAFGDYELSCGDYIYDIILDTATGSRHTLIDRAYFNVIKDTAPKSPIGSDFLPRRLESLDYSNMCLSTTPLICNFNYNVIEKVKVPGTLILFNNIKASDNPEDPESSDDTLILFGDREQEDESTLILF